MRVIGGQDDGKWYETSAPILETAKKRNSFERYDEYAAEPSAVQTETRNQYRVFHHGIGPQKFKVWVPREWTDEQASERVFTFIAELWAIKLHEGWGGGNVLRPTDVLRMAEEAVAIDERFESVEMLPISGDKIELVLTPKGGPSRPLGFLPMLEISGVEMKINAREEQIRDLLEARIENALKAAEA